MKQRNENINNTIRKGQDALKERIAQLEQKNKELIEEILAHLNQEIIDDGLSGNLNQLREKLEILNK